MSQQFLARNLLSGIKSALRICNENPQRFLNNRKYLHWSIVKANEFLDKKDRIVEIVGLKNSTAEWIPAKASSNNEGAVLFMHGGAFVFLSAACYRYFTSHLADSCGSPVFSVDYRLSPETIFPGAINDCVDAYRYLIETKKINPSKIVFAGDSAGGNIAVSSLLKSVHQCDLPSPGGLLLLSPVLDLAATHEELQERPFDPILPSQYLPNIAWMYTQGNLNFDAYSDEKQKKLMDSCIERGMPYVYKDRESKYKNQLKNPLVSPIYMNDELAKLIPKTLIQVGTQEFLMTDAEKFASLVNKHGVAYLEKWDDMHHVFQLSYPIHQTGRRAVARCAEYIRSIVD
eukprot:GHVL01033770.1.p1 GENE.GHVL01033770.1~~GHVL01033770.1.p1  ORF type:complete len:344 (+),score=48.66 GHVL01033770.1:19-1050(+)